MKDDAKTKTELINELSHLRERIAQLEKAEIAPRRTEEILCASQPQLSDALDLANIVYWEVDPTTMNFVFNDAFYTLYGTTAEREGGYRMTGAEYKERFVHPDDLRFIAGAREEGDLSREPEFSRDVEYRIIRRDGKVRDILARIRISRDSTGRISKYHGANQDITERKQAEAMTRRLASFPELNPNPILEVNVSGEVTFYNPATLTILARLGMNESDCGAFVPEDLHGILASWDRQSDVMLNREVPVGDMVFEEDIQFVPQFNVARIYGRDITVRKLVKEALLESVATYRSLFGNMLDGIAYCEMLFDDGRPVDFIYLDVNDAFERLTGLKDVAGKKVTEVIPGVREAHPELFETYGRVVVTGKPEVFEIEFKPLGRWFSISVYSAGKNRFVATFDNITDRKKTEEALRESESCFKGALEASGVGIALVTLDGCWLKMNQSLCLMLGYSEQELLTKTLQDITHPDDLETDLEYVKRLIDDQIPYYRLEKRYYHRDGYVVWGALSVSLVRDARGYPLYFVGQIEDITENKLLEEKLQTMSITDELTGLYNRRGFFELASEQLRLASRNKEGHVLLFADLDHLKWINDTFGHQEGDAALAAAARLLKDTFRESDIIGRIGGDEFAILAMGATEAEREVLLARLQLSIERFNTDHTSALPISISIGFTRYEPENPCQLEALLTEADESMYERKRRRQGIRS